MCPQECLWGTFSRKDPLTWPLQGLGLGPSLPVAAPLLSAEPKKGVCQGPQSLGSVPVPRFHRSVPAVPCDLHPGLSRVVASADVLLVPEYLLPRETRWPK